MHDIEANKAVALEFLKSLETGPRFDLVADKARWWIQGHGFLSLAEFRALVERVASTKAPSVMTIHHVTAEEDRVAIECQGKGRLHDGRAYENTYHFLFFVRDGLVAEVHEHFDTAYARDVLKGHAAGQAEVRPIGLTFAQPGPSS
ncbi:MAG: nuclear transport factor 2 family protein [Novosphingobium sp.]|nr:nuclear transport factor 2 family protein [Novosphingobium sp.]